MSILTPTTEEIRDQHALDEFGQRDWSTDLSYAEFDRWLTAHDAETRTEAMAEQAAALKQTGKDLAEARENIHVEAEFRAHRYHEEECIYKRKLTEQAATA